MYLFIMQVRILKLKEKMTYGFGCHEGTTAVVKYTK